MNGRAVALEWRNDLDAAVWDDALASLGGHPLQSALWGDARKAATGTSDRRSIALRGGVPVWMIRIEERRLGRLGRAGWAPRGPTGMSPDGDDLPARLRADLGRTGMVLLVTDRWEAQERQAQGGPAPRTIWIDLGVGLEALSRNLDKQWRYGLSRAKRLGVTVEVAGSEADTAAFFALYSAVGEAKNFALTGSIDMMRHLLGNPAGSVEARLFLARQEGRIGAGAFVIRCGRSLHYFWGATDRELSQARVGEAVQWAAMEWGVAQGCTRYDLEGIDPDRNPGTYAFKKKMGGTEVTLPGHRMHAIGLTGRGMAWLYGAYLGLRR